MAITVGFFPGTHPEDLGDLPQLVSETDPRPVKEQFHTNYAYGGGWRPMQGFTLHGLELHYPGDPPFIPIAMFRCREELVLVYPCSIICIVQPDMTTFEVARMD